MAKQRLPGQLVSYIFDLLDAASYVRYSILISYYFAKKRRSLGRHSSLADQSHEVFFLIRAPCPANHSLLDFTIPDEWYKSRRFYYDM
jgi:hypothetical protein